MLGKKLFQKKMTTYSLNYISTFLFMTFIICIALNVLLIKKKEFFYKLYPDYNPIQKIHDRYVPPIGGLVIFILFYLFIFINYPDSFFTKLYILIPSIFIIIIGLIEDIFGKASAILRLIIIFSGSLIFTSYTKYLPNLEIWLIGEIINNNSILKIVFFAICLTAISNGMNMIDGMNGLAALTGLSILACIFSIIYVSQGMNNYLICIISLALLLFTFLIFNFPFGKIFLGDSGAYWIGWLLGAMVIDLYSDNKFNTWGAVLVLFYPTIEVVFSTIRKLIQKRSPFKSDIEHLHLKLYLTLKGPVKRSPFFNSFTTLCLMPFWAVPPLAIMWVNYVNNLTILFLILITLFYFIYYFMIKVKKS